MSMMTFEDAERIHEALSKDDFEVYVLLRRWAAQRYCDELVRYYGPDHGFDCGTSDVSIELTEAIRSREVPMIGPVRRAYEACGFPIKEG